MKWRDACATIVLSGLAAQGCNRIAAAGAPLAKPPGNEVWIKPSQAEGLTIEPARERAIEQAIRTSGRITFDEQRVSHVFSPITGRFVRIEAQLGQHVKKGDILAIVQSPDVSVATSELAKADADRIAAEHDFARKKDLFAQHACARADLEASEDNFRKAKAELDRAKQKTELLRTGGSLDAVSSTFALRSPLDGEVIARSVSPNMEVQGEYGGGSSPELFTIGDVGRVWLSADLFERDLGRVRLGARVHVKSVARPDRAFDGVVDWVSSTLDPTTRTARVRCVFENTDHALLPEMYVSVEIVTDELVGLSLPRSAFVRMGDETVVFIAQEPAAHDGRLRFERRRLRIEEGADRDAEHVLDGLSVGERVAVGGAILLSEQ